MKRMALLIAVVAVTLSVVLYISGSLTVLFSAALIFAAALLCALTKRRFKYYISATAVLLLLAAFGVYLALFDITVVDKAEALAGKSGTVTCFVTEEPSYSGGYTVLKVKTSRDPDDNSGLCGSVRFVLWADDEDALAAADIGDVFTADVAFSKLSSDYKAVNYADMIYISAKYTNAEITGHKYTLYETAVDIRRTVRNKLNENFEGEVRALANGIVLGDNSDMSEELLSDFTVCGANHITAVSGMHIGVLCVAFVSLLELFIRRRRAVLIAIIPTVLVVAVTGFTPSAIRAGTMCIITFLGQACLKRSDALNSLGLAITLMLIYNPFYICNLGFQLSCTATAGVITFMNIYNEHIGPRIHIKVKLISKVVHGALTVFVQSIGAVLFTMPIQILFFGFVSVVAPIASVAICAAVSYSLITIVVGILLSFIPFVGAVSAAVFAVAELLLSYVITAITVIARIPFSYIPFGTNTAMLFIAASLAVIGVWILLDRVGGKRPLAVLIAALLVVGLWSDKALNRGIVEISSVNLEKGFCTVIYSGEKCVIIGCGDQKDDAYTIESELRLRGVSRVDAILLPSDAEACTGGAAKLCEMLGLDRPKLQTVSGEVYETLENVSITAHAYDGGRYYEVLVYDKVILIGFGEYTAEQCDADVLISGRVLPTVGSADIAVIACGHLPQTSVKNFDEVYYSSLGSISLKLKEGKGITVYAKQE